MPDEPTAADESAEHRGWYNSSMELRRGLDVVEDVELDTLPAEFQESFLGQLR